MNPTVIAVIFSLALLTNSADAQLSTLFRFLRQVSPPPTSAPELGKYDIQVNCEASEYNCENIREIVRQRLAQVLPQECPTCTPDQLQAMNKIVLSVAKDERSLFRVLFQNLVLTQQLISQQSRELGARAAQFRSRAVILRDRVMEILMTIFPNRFASSAAASNRLGGRDFFPTTSRPAPIVVASTADSASTSTTSAPSNTTTNFI